jgi:hypothetical protein
LGYANTGDYFSYLLRLSTASMSLAEAQTNSMFDASS